jgi:dihydroorotate dehydrogenase
MSWFYERLVRPALFTQEAEQAHERMMRALAMVSRNSLLAEAVGSFFGAPQLPVEVFGLRFPNPVGLAAGMDKYATALPAWESLGFGFTELGGVTQQAQPGNPAPRLFRAVPEEAIVNRMGFNNPGAEDVAQTLAMWRNAEKWPRHPVGINLGKSKVTSLDKAAVDYAFSVRALWPHTDFFVVNVSSPNTPNLRQLQDKDALAGILKAIEEEQVRSSKLQTSGAKHQDLLSPALSSKGGEGVSSGKLATIGSQLSTSPKPVLVKVSPDLSFEALDELLELAVSRKLAGIVATNTTTERPQSADEQVRKVYAETGGLSGAPLRARSTEVIRHIYRQTKGKLPIIGVGGIFTAEDAWEKIAVGASLLQVYTGLVYKGPGLAKEIVTGLMRKMEETGVKTIAEAVGNGCER